MNLIKSLKKDNKIYILIDGEGSMQNSHPLSVLLGYARMEKSLDIILDFSNCDYIDSTFIGVITGYAIFLKENGGKLACNNVKESIKDTLNTMGVSRFLLFNDDMSIPQNGYKELKNLPITTVQRTKYILNAHRTLTGLSDENKKKFADVMRFLEVDLKSYEDSL